ncbi:hypothetical protein [Gallaecimonas xiamenensis]|uniref:Uncharacterized protein n=1 Tax=Gallaecimonas xiamenensis 3-C-1 TaxID=745411 RepID=K2K2V9_9GAMM|nr:hypothetical protein [Gallaecimonas xiamenensis]EKE77164.1 hypothetical protein B3C1_03125 [Gallaecimonas xiamenensis 3-C-1]
MKKSLFALFGMMLCGQVLADDVTYSNEEYCAIRYQVTQSHLAAYADKLGYAPSDKECRLLQIKDLNGDKAAWDFQGNRPYAGSVMRLPVAVVVKLRDMTPAQRAEALSAH